MILSSPVFWIGLILLSVFAFGLGWFPVAGSRNPATLVLPAVTLALPIAALLGQVLRDGIETAERQPFATTVRARGAGPTWLTLHHTLRHGGTGALTLAAYLVGSLLGGAVLVETVFARPGSRPRHAHGDHRPRPARHHRHHPPERPRLRRREPGRRAHLPAARSAAAPRPLRRRRAGEGARVTASRRVALGAAIAVLALIAALALAPQLFATQDPLQTDVRAALLPPSAEHYFGTDQSGRDVYSRVVYGTGRSVGIGLLATALAFTVGLTVGALSGVAPRVVDVAAMRATDILLAFPEFLIALVVVAVLGPGPVNVAIAVTIAAIPVYIRLARAQTRTLRLAEHVEAARILGVPGPLAFTRHVVPGVVGALSVLATIGIGSSILAAAGLSFLGLGPTEPTPEWGLMLSGGRNVIGQAWWISVFPGAAITLTVIAATVLGRVLRARSEGRTR